MGKIKILSEKMTKMISAGEVVDKPASIIKELVENSIDAGATAISIEIVNGGQSKIVISDNGCGMNEDDIKLSIFPHATSKIEVPEDLNKIATLGFRGEALASICAVSEASILSKTAQQDFGYLAKIDEGKIVSFTEINCEKGTRIEVSNLFYNTPARLKFLRKPKTDEADITDYVEKLMLAYSNISFKYYIDGKIRYNTSGSGLFDNIYTIYGKEIIDNLIKIDETKDNYHLYGYIGKPQIAKPNRNYQTLLVGGRYVKNQMISSAVSNAFENFLMKGKFPFYVLFLDLPLESLDVNIHPTKLEVKFEKPNFVYGLVSEVISKMLTLTNYEKTITLVEEKESERKFENGLLDNSFGVSFNQQKNNQEEIVLSNNNCEEKIENKINSNNEYEINNFSKINSNEDTKQVCPFALREENQKEDTSQTNFVDLGNQNPSSDKITFSKQNLFEKIENKNQVDTLNYKKEKIVNEKINFDEYIKVGRVFETYILIQQNDEMYIIDQHAAHERILFDKFMNEIQNNQIAKQDMLFPYVFNVKDKDFVKVKELCPLLTEFGFEIYEFGDNSFKIDSVPLLLQNIDLKDFVGYILSENFYNQKSTDIIRNTIASHACKSAVKGGDSLSDSEVDCIVKNIKNGVLLCPHGRPFVMKLSKNQLEKWFGRIV